MRITVIWLPKRNGSEIQTMGEAHVLLRGGDSLNLPLARLILYDDGVI